MWKEKFLKQTIVNAHKGLKTGKYLALNVANTKQYKTFEEDVVSLAKEVGFEHTDTWWLSLSTQQGGSMYQLLMVRLLKQNRNNNIWVSIKNSMLQDVSLS